MNSRVQRALCWISLVVEIPNRISNRSNLQVSLFTVSYMRIEDGTVVLHETILQFKTTKRLDETATVVPIQFRRPRGTKAVFSFSSTGSQSPTPASPSSPFGFARRCAENLNLIAAKNEHSPDSDDDDASFWCVGGVVFLFGAESGCHGVKKELVEDFLANENTSSSLQRRPRVSTRRSGVGWVLKGLATIQLDVAQEPSRLSAQSEPAAVGRSRIWIGELYHGRE